MSRLEDTADLGNCNDGGPIIGRVERAAKKASFRLPESVAYTGPRNCGSFLDQARFVGYIAL